MTKRTESASREATGRRLTEQENLGGLLMQALDESARSGRVFPADDSLRMPAMIDGYFNLPAAAARFLQLVEDRKPH